MKEKIKKLIEKEVSKLKEKAASIEVVKYKTLNIEEVRPSELSKFMADNNIPDTAEFSADFSGTIILEWPEGKRLMSRADIRSYISNKFHTKVCLALKKMLNDMDIEMPPINVSRAFRIQAYHLWLEDSDLVVNEYYSQIK